MVFVNSWLQKAFFKFNLTTLFGFRLRKIYWKMRGAIVGDNTKLSQLSMTWPHQLKLGSNCILEDDIFFKFDGPWKLGPSIIIQDRVFIGKGCEFNIRQNIYISNDCLIASGCKFIDHDHGTTDLNQPMNLQLGSEIPIFIEENVWLGVNVVILKGVTIGKNSIVGAGAVVTKSIPANEVWAGIPAKKIKDRAS